MSRAGQPEILDFPAGYEDYLKDVQANPAFEETVKGMAYSFKLVEIDPLIAFQIRIELERSANLCSGVSIEPLVGDMLKPCLPTTVEGVPVSLGVTGSSLTVESESLNLKFSPAGPSGAPTMAEISLPNERRVRTVGMHFFPSSPLVQIVRYQDRCFLKNGYHRAYGFAKAGANHVPCVFLEGETSFGAIGVVPRATFQPDVLLCDNPPTMGHFVQDRAYEVNLKSYRQVLRINWSYQILAN
jgi:hypothetical protein